MSVESIIYGRASADSAIIAIVGSKIYWSVSAQGSAPPLLVIYRIDTFDRKIFHNGVASNAKTRFQFSCFGSTPTEARSLSRAVRLAFHGYTGTSGGTTVFIAQAVNEVELVDEHLGNQIALDIIFTHTE